MIFQLDETIKFPPPYLAREDGLLAVGGDLSLPRLLLAYSQGIFPWFSAEDPILWWWPDPRLVLLPAEFHLSRSLARTIRRGIFEVTFDQDFAGVIAACSKPRPGQEFGTWLVPEMVSAYNSLYEAGYAHSVECWQEGELVGGLYGVALGRIFFGESMFSAKPDSSKVAMAALVERLMDWGFDLIDCQVESGHLRRLGARQLSGRLFQGRLEKFACPPHRLGSWQ